MSGVDYLFVWPGELTWTAASVATITALAARRATIDRGRGTTDRGRVVRRTAWAIVSMPHVRFTGELSGDEPKYVRYCETWYQGGGCDVSRKQLIADLPAYAPSHVADNFVLLDHRPHVRAAIRDATARSRRCCYRDSTPTCERSRSTEARSRAKIR